jgi:hypothetical protein
MRSRNLKGINQFGDLAVDGRIILSFILKENRVWNG